MIVFYFQLIYLSCCENTFCLQYVSLVCIFFSHSLFFHILLGVLFLLSWCFYYSFPWSKALVGMFSSLGYILLWVEFHFTYSRTCTYRCVCIYVCVCVYVYVYTHTQLLTFFPAFLGWWIFLLICRTFFFFLSFCIFLAFSFLLYSIVDGLPFSPVGLWPLFYCISFNSCSVFKGMIMKRSCGVVWVLSAVAPVCILRSYKMP